MPTATIQMWGKSCTVRIPKALAEELELQPGTIVDLSRDGQALVIKAVRAQKRYRLSDLLAECKWGNPSGELIRGRVGKEPF